MKEVCPDQKMAVGNAKRDSSVHWQELTAAQYEENLCDAQLEVLYVAGSHGADVGALWKFLAVRDHDQYARHTLEDYAKHGGKKTSDRDIALGCAVYQFADTLVLQQGRYIDAEQLKDTFRLVDGLHPDQMEALDRSVDQMVGIPQSVIVAEAA